MEVGNQIAALSVWRLPPINVLNQTKNYPFLLLKLYFFSKSSASLSHWRIWSSGRFCKDFIFYNNKYLVWKYLIQLISFVFNREGRWICRPSTCWKTNFECLVLASYRFSLKKYGNPSFHNLAPLTKISQINLRIHFRSAKLFLVQTFLKRTIFWQLVAK